MAKPRKADGKFSRYCDAERLTGRVIGKDLQRTSKARTDQIAEERSSALDTAAINTITETPGSASQAKRVESV